MNPILNDFIDQQSSILRTLEQGFSEDGLFVEFFSKADSNFSDILMVEHSGIGYWEEDVISQYYFLPEEGSNPANHFFCSTIILTDDLNYAASNVLADAIAQINYILPKGIFFISAEKGNLVYRYTASLSSKLNSEELLTMIKNEILSSLFSVSLWYDILMELNNENADLKDFKSFYENTLNRLNFTPK